MLSDQVVISLGVFKKKLWNDIFADLLLCIKSIKWEFLSLYFKGKLKCPACCTAHAQFLLAHLDLRLNNGPVAIGTHKWFHLYETYRQPDIFTTEYDGVFLNDHLLIHKKVIF